MTIDAYADYDGVGLAELVAKKEVTPLELVDAAIDRIEQHNPALNAVVYKGYDDAREWAKGDLPDGPFKGVPFLIKDLGVKVANWPATSGSHYLRDYVPTEDSILAKRYREAGLVFVGKTNTPEYGITGTSESARLGPCRNPWNPDHIAGGSSGGAASAVGAGIVPMAHASDGLGSIRIPAACCGLVGMKTTRARNPDSGEDGERAMGFSVDHVVTRTVRDSAAMLDATCAPEPDSPYPPLPYERPFLEEVSRTPGKLKIACSMETPSNAPIDEENAAAFEKTVALLKELGHEVVEQGLGVDYRTLYRAQGAVSASNFAAAMMERSEMLGRQPEAEELEPLTWQILKASERISGPQAFWGWRTLRKLSRQILHNLAPFDAYLCPVMGTPPPEIGFIDPVTLEPKEVNKRQAKVFPFTPPFNFTGQPSLSLPLWWSKDNLPLGMMFTGRYGDEATLYRLAGQLEQAQPWADKRPPVWS